jgi:hypothetical protein
VTACTGKASPEDRRSVAPGAGGCPVASGDGGWQRVAVLAASGPENAAMALQRAHRAYVLETGSIVRSDEAGRLLDDDSVRAAYVGGAVSG